MKKYYKIVLLLTLPFFGFSQKTEIYNLLQKSYEQGIFNGNAMIAKNGKIIYNQSFGYADGSKIVKLTPQLRFNIGSITKEFSAISIMQLHEKGELKLEDKISKYLSDLPEWAEKISIKNILEYTSGIPEMNWGTIKSDADAYTDLKKITKLQFEPGTDYKYTFNNVMLRQFVVEHITGISFNNYVEKYILKPCKMKASVLLPYTKSNNIATSFNNKSENDTRQLLVSGIVLVTTKDLFRFIQKLHAGKLINRQSINTLGHSYVPTNGGLGNTKFENNELVFHQHDGQSLKFEATMQTNLKTKTTIILLGNNKNEKLQEIVDGINKILEK